MADRLMMGIDVGTTSVKAGLLDTQGRIVTSFAESYATTRADGGVVEQDADAWARLVDKALARFAAEGHAPHIAAIGLCSQVNTHVFVGADGGPLRPAIVWQDVRAAAQASELDRLVDVQQKIDWWGAPLPIDASSVLARMRWVARHEPEVWDKTRWVMLPKDYCLLRLTGEAVTDPLSNLGLVDQQLQYLPAVLDLVPGAVDRVAPLLPVTRIAGRLGRHTPLPGCPIVSGTMDAWAGLVGAGGARAGSSVYLSGTSEILGISSPTVVPTRGAVVFPASDGIRLHAAPTQSGGDAKQWFACLAGLEPADMAELVAATPRSRATPLFLPQLEGERAPLWDANLRGAFLGLSRRTGTGDMARAVYEGVALSARHALQALQASADTVSAYASCGGGGFRSPAWNRIRADVLGMELRTLSVNEPGVLGAASMAAIGIGAFADFEQAHQALARHDHVFEPCAQAHERYDELFELYQEAIVTQSGLARRLSAIARP